jgi:hypothetical protein
MMSAAELAHHLGGRRSSGRSWSCRCPVPEHRDRNPSFSISEGDDGKVLFHCFVCSQDQVVDALRARGLFNGHTDHLDRRRYDYGRIEHPDRDIGTLALVNAIWGEATNPAGTIAEQYLRSRKLILPLELGMTVLRIHPACVWENGTAPCLIAAFRSIKDDSLTAVHRIRLDQPGHWPSAERKMLGRVTGSAIKLDPASDHLVVGEGLETCLAARQLGLRPVWALGSASGIESLAPIDGIDELIVLGENDNGRNQTAAETCRDNWKQSRVLLMTPQWGKDFNDYLLEHGNDFAS